MSRTRIMCDLQGPGCLSAACLPAELAEAGSSISRTNSPPSTASAETGEDTAICRGGAHTCQADARINTRQFQDCRRALVMP